MQHLFWIKERLTKYNVEPLAVYQNLLITPMMKDYVHFSYHGYVIDDLEGI